MFALHSTKHREVSEWLKEHAWKVCMLQGIESSNLFLSASACKSTTYRLFYVLIFKFKAIAI
jgi:hypothetical protein